MKPKTKWWSLLVIEARKVVRCTWLYASLFWVSRHWSSAEIELQDEAWDLTPSASDWKYCVCHAITWRVRRSNKWQVRGLRGSRRNHITTINKHQSDKHQSQWQATSCSSRPNIPLQQRLATTSQTRQRLASPLPMSAIAHSERFFMFSAALLAALLCSALHCADRNDGWWRRISVLRSFVNRLSRRRIDGVSVWLISSMLTGSSHKGAPRPDTKSLLLARDPNHQFSQQTSNQQ